MNELVLNETPIRTSRNFNINNIKIDCNMPENILGFSNLEIKNENAKIKIDENISINKKLTYGVGTILTDKKSNKTLKIEIDSKENKEVFLDFKFDKKNNVLFDNIEIIANENTSATVIIKYTCEENFEYFHNLVLKTVGKNNSNLNVIIINFMNLESHNFMSIENQIKTSAKVNYKIIDFGGKESITNFYSNLLEKEAENTVDVIYLGEEKQLFDLNYIEELRGEKSNASIEVQGALNDLSKKHFKGTIDFKKGAKKAIGYENDACMLLSDMAKSLSLPMLLCSEEDVEGNHSSSAGKIGKKELFYIQSRGFNSKEATKLMVRAKFNRIIESIESNELKEEILQKIDEKLD